MTQPVDAACQLLQVGELPVAMSSNRPMIPASMNGRADTAGSHIAHDVFDTPDMIIGADFFMAHRIYVARSQGKIYFTYNGGPIFQHVQGNIPATSGEAGAADSPPQ